MLDDTTAILTQLTDQFFSLKGIVRTIDENFADELNCIMGELRPNRKKNDQEMQRLYKKVLEVLPTDELRRDMSELDNLYTTDAGDAQIAFMAIGIMFGLKLAGASRERIQKVCEVLGIEDSYARESSTEGETR